MKYPRHFLKEWREVRGLTQRQLADRAGTTNQQISRLEGRQRELRQRWIDTLCAALHISPEELLRCPPSLNLQSDEGDEVVVQAQQLIIQLLRSLIEAQAKQTKAIEALVERIEGHSTKPSDACAPPARVSRRA